MTIKTKVILAKKFKNILPINLENFVVLTRSLYLKNGLRYRHHITVTFQGDPRSKVMVPNERLYACSYLWIIVTICLTATVTKILALVYHKYRYCVVTWPEMHLMTPKRVKCSAHKRIFWSKPEVFVFKNGWDMANLINFMFCDITWLEMHWLNPKFKFFVKNLYATKMQSFINLGWKKNFFNFSDIIFSL